MGTHTSGVQTLLEQYLKEIRTGSGFARRKALAALSSELVFVPVIRSENVGDAKKVRIVSDHEGDNKVIFAFSSEEGFQIWADGKDFSYFSLAAGDLALTVPEGSRLEFNRGTPSAVRLSAEEVQVLAYPSDLEIEEEPEVESESATETADRDVESELARIADLDESEFLKLSDPDLVRPERATTVGEEIQMLTALFAEYSQIEEAYFIEDHVANSNRQLGILRGSMDGERRFGLIEGIAEISRKCFGEAGIIEVYDDLHSPHSSSWELFNAQAPFFSRSRQDESFNELLREREVTTFQTAGEEPPMQGQKSLWSRLRRKTKASLGKDDSH